MRCFLLTPELKWDNKWLPTTKQTFVKNLSISFSFSKKKRFTRIFELIYLTKFLNRLISDFHKNRKYEFLRHYTLSKINESVYLQYKRTKFYSYKNIDHQDKNRRMRKGDPHKKNAIRKTNATRERLDHSFNSDLVVPFGHW